MSQQARFFRKNLIDLDYQNVSFEITDSVATGLGATTAVRMLNRNNTDGFSTTGSSDAGTTTMILTFTDVLQFDSILLVAHNLKSFSLQYWDDIAETWEDFSTAVNETTNEKDTNLFQFDTVNSSKLKLVISGTIVEDEDKIIRQFIVTRKIKTGAFIGWPVLTAPTIDLNKKTVPTISGKSKVTERVANYSVNMEFRSWPNDSDLSLLEDLHFYQPNGFLFWPGGGDIDQFRYERIAFRLRDIFLCAISSEWVPEWNKNIYKNGVNMRVSLVETL